MFLREGSKIHLWYLFEVQIEELYPRYIEREFMGLEAGKLHFSRRSPGDFYASYCLKPCHRESKNKQNIQEKNKEDEYI